MSTAGSGCATAQDEIKRGDDWATTLAQSPCRPNARAKKPFVEVVAVRIMAR